MTLRFLVVGAGAREHAIVSALHLSKKAPWLMCIGSASNPGIRALTQAYEVKNLLAIDEIGALAKREKIDIAIIGPEAPLELA